VTTKAEKLERIQKALQDYQLHGSDLFDHQAEEAKAAVRHRGLLLLDQRARSRHELKQRLLALDFDDEVVESVLVDFERAKLVDDHAFATQWVKQRHQRRGKSRAILDQELQQKGVSAEIRYQALDQITAADEGDMALMLARKKARTLRHIPSDRAEKDKCLRRIIGVLARRGFGQSLCLTQATQALDERIAELAE
jgi:hypothetical protein